MDSKHRHELEKNELAKWIVAQYEDWIRPNSSWLGYAVLGVLVVVFIIMATARINTWNRSAAWKQYYAALHSPQAETDLELLAQSTSGVVSTYARLTLAHRLLSEGCSQVFTDKTKAIVTLEKALASFQQVQNATSDPLFLQQAGFDLGQCWESLAAARVGDDLTQAESEYQKVVDQWGDEFVGQRAKKRLALLRQPATVAFLAFSAEKAAEPTEMDDFISKFGSMDPFEPGQMDFGSLDDGVATDAQRDGTNTEPKQESESESHEQ
jgi:hypothetical protein